MDGRLFQAARTGSVSALHQLLVENPLVLADCALISPHENPLHVATKAGQLAFVKEIIKQRADLVSQANQDGFRPLDIASVLGHVEIVEEIITTCHPDICRLKGREGRTCLHYAAINERVEIIDELLTTCGECVKDVTSLGETALHLALKYYKLEAFTNLVKWLERLGLEELVNSVDKDGNTILHLAVSRKQLQSVEILLSSSNISSILELNVRNSRGFTAMDLLDNTPIDNPNDFRLKEILQFAGALGTETPHNTLINNPKPSTGVPKDWIKYFQFQMERDSPSDTRNALLVVAALIATVTFQAVMNPPSAANSANTANSAPPPADPPTENRHPAAILGLLAVFASLGSAATFNLFLFGNTLSLAASLSIIIYLTNRFPFQRELQIAIYSMMFTYGCAVHYIKSAGASKYFVLVIALLLPLLFRWLPRWVRKFWKWLKGN